MHCSTAGEPSVGERPASRQPVEHRSGASTLDRAALWAGVLVAVYGAAQIFLAFRDYGTEDAFITYRYAQNLAAGNGFVFNPGERVLGTSTPLYALVLGAAGAVGLDIAATSATIFAASLAVTALLGAALLRRHGHRWLSVLFATFTIWCPGDLLFFFGMETPFYIMLLFAAWSAALVRRDGLAAALAGLAFLTRHDGVLFAAGLLLLIWRRDRRLPWRAAITCAAVVLPWLVFATLYFGSPVPNTLTAKAGEVTPLEYLRVSSVQQMVRAFSPLDYLVSRRAWPHWVFPALTLILLGPVPVAWRGLTRREPVLALALFFPASLWAGYTLIGAAQGFAWYLVPASYFLVLLGLVSWGRLLELLRQRLAVTAAPARLLAVVVTTALVATTLVTMPTKLRAHATSLVDNAFYRGRNGVYLTLARWIRDHDLADVSVLTDEPGYFAYHSKSPVIDAAGLITKDIYFTGPVERRTPGMEIIERWKPGFILTANVPWPRLKLRDYVVLYEPQPVRILYARRSVFEERFESLAERWLARDGYLPGGGAPLRHPLSWDFGAGETSGWVTGGELQSFVARPRAAIRKGLPVKEDMLETDGAPELWGTVTSPPFLIDFDELRFVFGATHPERTRARLLVDGQAVLAAGGVGGAAAELAEVRWPVWSWAGKVAVLQFQDGDTEGGFLVADRIRSMRYEAKSVLDDFESGSYGEQWMERMGTALSSLDEVARAEGLGFLVGQWAATSRGLDGEPRLASRPFVVDRDQLSFLVFDFGGLGTRIELEVDGKAQRTFRGTKSKRLQPVVWPLRELRGKEAVLTMVDQSTCEPCWIGIDDIAMFDLRAKPRVTRRRQPVPPRYVAPPAPPSPRGR